MSLNYQEVINEFNKLLDPSPPLTLEAVIVELNIDSLEFYSAILEIEEMFQIEFNFQQLGGDMSKVTMNKLLDNSVEFGKYKM